MSPIQQMLLGAGAVAKKTYVDDVFNTYVYRGSSSAQTFNTGVDLANEGGLLWNKYRTMNSPGVIFDTERGKTKVLRASGSDAEGTANTAITSFNNNGFSVGGGDAWTNFNSNHTFVNMTFRRAKGFCDVVTYTGNGTAGRQLSHNLGCAPGMVAIKCTSDAHNWTVWHRGLSSNAKTLTLNDNAAEFTADDFNGAAPSSTVIHLSSTANSNGDGKTYVAYLWAGGDSTAATARSVALDGNDYLSVGSSSDYSMGTGDFTVECWAKSSNTSNKGFFQISSTSGGLQQSNYWQTIAAAYNGSQWACYGNGTFNTIHTSSNETFETDTWYHIAYVRSSGTSKLYVNGVEKISFSDTYDYDGTDIAIGSYYSSGQAITGNISNFRVVKGTAIYTAPFTVPDTPLASTTNTKLLCCNNSSVTGSTVASGTITSTGDPTASTDSPVFDDDAAHIFGESGSESVIKTGSYVGNGSSTGPEINLGFEPQLVIIKRTDASENWFHWDSMRGIVTGGNDARLILNSSGVENDTTDRVDLTSTGFKPKTVSGEVNADGGTYIYFCIRRPDGYVGKPPELGTSVFAMDTGNGSTTIPNFDSGFPVDFGITRKPAASDNWPITARLTQGSYLYTDLTNAEAAWAVHSFDSNAGIYNWNGYNTDYQSWMWKRHAGFDVVTYIGDGVAGLQVPHNLNGVPEMIWTKCRGLGNDYAHWGVGHKDLDGGTAPWTHHLVLDENDAEADWDGMFNDTAPTATHFTVGEGSTMSNANGENMLAILFRSVDKISKVGSYTGNGSSTGPVISLGFTPRFILFKNASSGGNGWAVLDTLRGLGTSSQKRIWLDGDWEQDSGNNYVTTTSTSFQPVMNNTEFNENNSTIIYYAHA